MASLLLGCLYSDYEDKCSNMDRWGSVTPWFVGGWPRNVAPSAMGAGNAVDQTPIDVVHWGIQSPGIVGSVQPYDSPLFIMVRL